ncbi:MFS transporter [Nocardia brevicatena]|uniref:MFS transporter n=1 Tax=Nocardia brevicatena TaxID=37327 RepID=UPI0012F74E87|nr:MFS transporter [Nocardia brevicatena]
MANDPVETYEALLRYGPSAVDFLLPHRNWTTLLSHDPDHATVTPYANWLIAVFEHWYRAPTLETSSGNVVLLVILVDLKNSGRPAWTIGVVLGAAGAGGMLGAAAAVWLTRCFPSQHVYKGALWCWAALLIPTTLSDNPFVLAACWGGIGGVGVVSNVALTMYRVDVIPEHVLGRAMATIYFVCYGAAALGALSAGYLLSFLGVAATWWAVLSSMLTLAVCGSIRSAHPLAGTSLHSR